MDEIASPSADGEKHDIAPASKTPVRAYGDAVLGERQPRVTDFVLVRPLHLSVAILSVLTIIAAIVAAYTQAVVAAGGMLGPQLAAMNLESRGSLATWFGSLLLAAGGAAAAVVYSMRRHRVDDYRGTYRVWLWTAAALLFGSADAATGLHDAIGAGLENLSSSALTVSGNIGWLSMYALVFGALAVRLAMEVWNSLASFATLASASLLYLLIGLLSLELLPRGGALIDAIAATTLPMLAHLTLVSAIGLYARHVHLDAQGRLLVNVQKGKKTKPKSRAKLAVVKQDSKDESEHGAGSSSRKAKVTAATVQTPPANKPAAAPGKPQSPTVAFQSSADDEDDEDGADYSGEHLSKVERKKLKRLARREQRRAA